MDDPFVLQTCPHIFFAGNQPQFRTATIQGDVPLRLDGDTDMMDAKDNSDSSRVRLLAIPKFNETGELILVDTETLEVEVVKFGVFKGHEEQK
jgi:DNA polymerase delta subunit 2